MRSGNPVLRDDQFAVRRPGTEAMTLSGTINKTAILLALVVVGAAWTWQLANPMPWMMFGIFAGLGLIFVSVFKVQWVPWIAPAYAVLEGFVVGGLSAMLEKQFPGIAMQAAGLTFGVFAFMLVIYRTGIIPVTDRLITGVFAATGAIALIYVIDIVLRMFGIGVPFIHDSGPLGIGISLLIVGVAAFNLLLDFHFIEEQTLAGAPRVMEWYGAFGLLVTLIWLYIEILRLLSKLNNR